MDLKDPQKALCIANIWANMKFLGNKYSEELTKAALKYTVD